MHSISGKKICIVTDELAGPDYNGGIGTACHGLALALAAAGFKVDILYTRVSEGVVSCHRGSFESHVEFFARRGVRLLSIAHDGAWHDFPAKSFNALNHLQSEAYDFVFFNDTHGTGFYPLLSRRTGNPRLAETRMGVVTHSATQWILDLNGEPITGPDSVRVMEMERRSIELSDVVLSPSAYLIGKYKGYGWKFPLETHVRRYILPDSVQAARTPEPKHRAVDELVFFGRLERRKGIYLFCDALDRMKYALRGKTVSFLGKDTVVNGISTLENIVARSAAWPFEVRVMQDFNREGALSYLQGGRRLAVMPSLEDNSPCVIQECLELGIPFIASSGSGGEELIAEASRAHCCFAPTVTALSEKIRTALETGVTTGELSFDPAQNEREVGEWLSRYLEGSPGGNVGQKRRPATRSGGGQPAITLLVTGSSPLERNGAALRLRSLASAFGKGSQVAVIAAAAEAPPGPAGAAAPTLSSASYGAFAAGLGKAVGHYVCIWDAGLDLNLEWLRRAKEHLASVPD